MSKRSDYKAISFEQTDRRRVPKEPGDHYFWDRYKAWPIVGQPQAFSKMEKGEPRDPATTHMPDMTIRNLEPTLADSSSIPAGNYAY